MDWNEEAASQARYVADHCFAAHRGAYAWRIRGHTIIFGSDAAESPRARREVELLRASLARRGVVELGFGLSRDRNSWAMIIRADDPAAWHLQLWQNWREILIYEAGGVHRATHTALHEIDAFVAAQKAISAGQILAAARLGSSIH